MNAKPKRPKAIFLDAAGTLFFSNMTSASGLAIFPDARRLLSFFRTRKIGNDTVATGLITNWGKRIHLVVESFGLDSHFDTVVCAGGSNRPKPDPSIFLAACEAVGCEPNECLHIGDSLFDDAMGAMDAGLQAIWVNRRGDVLHETEQEVVSMLTFPPVLNLEKATDILVNLLS